MASVRRHLESLLGPASASPPLPLLKLELRLLWLLEARRSCRLCAAASSSVRRRSVTWRPSLCILTFTLTGGDSIELVFWLLVRLLASAAMAPNAAPPRPAAASFRR